MIKQIKLLAYLVSAVIFVFIVVYSGLGVEIRLTELLGFYSSVVLLLATILINGKILLPYGFKAYLLFLFLLFINILFSFDSLTTSGYFLLYLTGGILWLTAFNTPEKYQRYFPKILITLGLFYGLLFIYYFATGDIETTSYNLYIGTGRFHNHLGDLWAAILILFLPNLRSKEKLQDKLPIIISGLLFVTLSFSRSAYIALMTGVIFYIWKSSKFYLQAKKNLIIKTLIFAFVLIVFSGVEKSVFMSRFSYFTKALEVVLSNPLGNVGVGNFGAFTYTDLPDPGVTTSGFTAVTHNIILEFIVGMGLLSLTFVFWLYKVTVPLIAKENVNKVVYQAMFITLLTNFMFDYTYIIPAMVWIWFSALGLSEKTKKL